MIFTKSHFSISIKCYAFLDLRKKNFKSKSKTMAMLIASLLWSGGFTI